MFEAHDEKKLGSAVEYLRTGKRGKIKDHVPEEEQITVQKSDPLKPDLTKKNQPEKVKTKLPPQ